MLAASLQHGRGAQTSTFCMAHRKTMITMGSPYVVWINTNRIVSSWYLRGAGCVTPPPPSHRHDGYVGELRTAMDAAGFQATQGAVDWYGLGYPHATGVGLCGISCDWASAPRRRERRARPCLGLSHNPRCVFHAGCRRAARGGGRRRLGDRLSAPARGA
jgi:hypothetical protein